MPFTSESARWMLKHRGGIASAKRFKALGYPNLVKATAARCARAARLRELKKLAAIIVECESECPCQGQIHLAELATWLLAERAAR